MPNWRWSPLKGITPLEERIIKLLEDTLPGPSKKRKQQSITNKEVLKLQAEVLQCQKEVLLLEKQNLQIQIQTLKQ